MAYDKDLAERVKNMLADRDGFVERKMFGGIGFLLRGNMACGILQNDLIVRVGPEKYSGLLQRPGAGPFDITGRVMKGWLRVEPEGYGTEDALSGWIECGAAFALSLPPK